MLRLRSSLGLCASLSCLLFAAPGGASELYASALVGPAYFHNDDDVSGADSSGFGVAAQLDVGAQLSRWLALHGTLILDDSRWMAFDESAQLNGQYVTTVLGLGLGVTASWQRWSAGLSSGAQLTWHPDPINPNDGSSGAGLGPFVALHGGYAIAVSDAVQLGARAIARYRVGKDAQDPSGYQLGVGLCVTFADASPALPTPSR
jgi:hypothetical protein